MAEKFTVSIRNKTGKGANRQLRNNKSGIAHNSGVVYGFDDPVIISMRSDHATKFIKDHLKSKTKIIDLTIKDEEKSISKKVILQAYQLAPSNNKLLHVDFREVKQTSIISMEVPINPVGECPAIKQGGVLQILRHNIMLKGKIANIPATIDVDISKLDFGNSIHISDLNLSKNVIPVIAKGEDIALITLSKALVEEEVVEEVPADLEEGESQTPTAAEEEQKK